MEPTATQPADPMLQFFTGEDLSERLEFVAKPFCDLAVWIVATLPRNPERTVTLRKLVEAMDAALRARIAK